MGVQDALVIVCVVTVAIMAAAFLGLSLAMPKMPDWAVNFPNKDYWSAPERRQ